MLGDRCLPSKDEQKRANSVQYVKDCVTMVKELDGYEMTIVPGTVGKIEPDATPEEEWEWAVDGMKQIYDHAMKEGIRLAIEPINRFETYFITRGAQALALAEATGPECGICLDTFHMNMEEKDPYQTILDAGDRLVDFHVADTNRMPAGYGQWDWLKVVGALEVVGYDGALTAEFVAPIDRTPANPYPDAVETEPVDISPEQKKFIQDHGSSLLSEGFYDWLVAENAKTLLPLIKYGVGHAERADEIVA
jgi:sugar phosphate isomerase/epimerase